MEVGGKFLRSQFLEGAKKGLILWKGPEILEIALTSSTSQFMVCLRSYCVFTGEKF